MLVVINAFVPRVVVIVAVVLAIIVAFMRHNDAAACEGNQFQ